MNLADDAALAEGSLASCQSAILWILSALENGAYGILSHAYQLTIPDEAAALTNPANWPGTVLVDGPQLPSALSLICGKLKVPRVMLFSTVSALTDDENKN